MPSSLRGHPLSPPEDPSLDPNSAARAHADLYERAHDAPDPLFPNSPPLESTGAKMQRSISQLAPSGSTAEDLWQQQHEPRKEAVMRSDVKPRTVQTVQRAPTLSAVPSRVASPLASPSAPSAYAAFSDPLSSPVPPRISFSAPPHRLPHEELAPLPLAHLVALVQALSRELDDAQASLRSQRAELAALERLVRDKGASEGEIERVKVRARTEEVDAVVGLKAPKRTAGGGNAPEEWSIDLPPEQALEPREALPPKTEVSDFVWLTTPARISRLWRAGGSRH